MNIMKIKRIIAVITMLSLVFSMHIVNFADPTEEFHVGLLPGEVDPNAPTGPEVVEYYTYKEEKKLSPGSLLGDVDLNTVGRGLFYDGTDFYFYIDTGVMATNYMFTIEGDRFFFGENGKMVKEQLVSYNDELYYFDANGAMYKNRWYSDEAMDESENKLVYTDYYFGPTGRAYRAPNGGTGLVVKTIEGQKYGFNSDGEKLEGYYDQNGVKLDPTQDPAYESCVYYFDPDENGAAATGWHYYEGAVRGSEYEENEEIVLFFDEKSCRKVSARASYAEQGRCVSRIIEGQRYMFDSNGVRKNNWYTSEPARGTASNTKYFNEEYDGYLQKGWFSAVPGSKAANGDDLILEINKKRHRDDEEKWFYAGKNGNLLKKTIRKIGAYVYAFDDDGVMQSDAFVRVKNGAFVKSYETDYLTKANILLDPLECGGNGDPHADDPTNYAGDNLDKDKGILKASDGEQWMYFLGSFGSEAQEGSMCKQNKSVKIELKDTDIYFMQNSVGGYTKFTASPLGNITTVVERSKQFIQNGVILKPNPDDYNYGVVRFDVATRQWEAGDAFLNYKNENIAAQLAGRSYYMFRVVNANGEAIKTYYKSFKDKNGSYIYVGYNGEFLGYFPHEGKFFQHTPGTLVDVNGNPIPASNNPCWAYKPEGNKKWIYGLPPEGDRLDEEGLYLNFSKNSNIAGNAGSYGPYANGIALWVYEEKVP